jgi:hypothetical protein
LSEKSNIKSLEIALYRVEIINHPFIRISTNNGHYITIQTIWRLHTNYTGTVEYVLGNHRLIDGPSNTNVFACRNCDVSERHHMFASQVQNAVKEILSSPIGRYEAGKRISSFGKSTSANLSGSAQEQISESSDFPEGSEDSSKEFKSASANAPTAEASVVQPTVAPVLPVLPAEANVATWGSYQQLNYAHNIRRFLQSRPKVFQSDVSEKPKTDENRGDGRDMDMDIVAPPPFPAGSSSAVVHVSEHLSEGGQDVAADYTYSDEATVNDGGSGNIYCKEGSGSGNGSGSKDNLDVNGELDCEYSRSTLTQHLMKIHDNVQEQIYLQLMKNSMGRDAYHPLVAFPNESSIAQQSSIVQPGNLLGL